MVLKYIQTKIPALHIQNTNKNGIILSEIQKLFIKKASKRKQSIKLVIQLPPCHVVTLCDANS